MRVAMEDAESASAELLDSFYYLPVVICGGE